MFLIGRTAKPEDALAVDERCEHLFAYPGPDDCHWMAFTSDHARDLKDPQNRMALYMTICNELDFSSIPINGVTEIPDSVIKTVLDSITGRGPMWWERKGHKFLKNHAKQGKGFA